MKNDYQSFLSQNFQFLEVKLSIYLNRCVFIMLNKKKEKTNNYNKQLQQTTKTTTTTKNTEKLEIKKAKKKKKKNKTKKTHLIKRADFLSF